MRLSFSLRLSLLATLAMALPAQQAHPERGTLSAWVADAAGKRVAAAEVTLLSWPLPPRTDVGAADRVQTRTDEKGFCRAELLHGRAYSAWATWRSADGVQHRTLVAEGVIPGPPRGLAEGPLPTPKRVRVRGLEAWAARGPLRVSAFAGIDNPVCVELTLDGEGTAEGPDLPGERFDVEVRAADGQLLAMALEEKAVSSECVLELPAPTFMVVRVEDMKGRPLAHATIYQANKYSAGGFNRHVVPDRLGATGADGTLRAQVPSRNPMWVRENSDCLLVVEADGMARMHAQCDLAKTLELKVTLPSAPSLIGRVLDGQGQPANGVLLLPESFLRVAGDDSGGAGVHARPLAFGSDGRFRFSGLHTRYGFRLLAIIDPARAVELGMRIRPDFALAPVLWLATGAPPFANDQDLGDLRLDRLVVARIEVHRHDGEPVPGALIRVTTRDLYNSPIVYTSDRVGRMQFPLPDGEVRIGAYAKGGGVATAVVRVPAGKDDPALDPLVLPLTKPVTVSGRVVDGNGRPIEGATVQPWNRPEGCDRELADLAFYSHAPGAPTGKDGAFTLTLPFGDALYRVKAFVRSGKGYASSAEFMLSAGSGDQTGVELTIDERDK